MVLIPAILLALFPPGFLFPQMAERMRAGLGLKKKGWVAKGANSGDAGEDGQKMEPTKLRPEHGGGEGSQGTP